MNKYLKYIFLLYSICYSQDILFTKDGLELNGEFDRNSADASSLRFRVEGTKNWKFYHTDLVNFVKSFNGSLLYPSSFVGNTVSFKYHFPNVIHLPPKEDRVIFSSFEEADSSGYSKCLACFDIRPTISDYYLEKALVHSVVIAFQNTNEIIYENDKLPVARQLVDKILASWPQTLKGYDYRIQVYRDDTPNAMAIGGGHLYISTGLLDIVENTDELEAVIAHEIAHVERRHSLREFYEYQKKKNQVAAATAIVGIAVIAAGGEVDEVAGAMTVTAILTDFAAELALKGHSREMEQESDILAQLYLDSVYGNGEVSLANGSKSYKEPLMAIFDKMARFSITRKGHIMGTNAFSTHPGLEKRIKQIEQSKIYKYERPLNFQAVPTSRKDFNEGFVELKVSHIYKAPSSNIPNEDVYYLVGSIKNNHGSLSFKIDEFKLNFLGSIGITSLEGVSGETVNFKSETDFTGIIRSQKEESEKLFESLKNKRILPFSIGLSAIVLQKGKNAKNVIGYNAIKCGMTIN